MTSMFDIVSEAASRGWDRARRVASRSREPASPDALARLIEADIIPRLLLNHRSEASGIRPQALAAPGEIPAGLADQFAAATLTEEVGPLLARVEALSAVGFSVETIYLDLLAPAARRLGSWWDEDACDFVDVTMGLWRLQEIVNALSSLIPGVEVHDGGARRALFSPAPGEQHGFGAMIVEEFFRRAGWQTWSAPALDEDELVALAAGREFDVIGLTVSVERHLETLEKTIASVRRASRNRNVLVLVGGRIFTARPDLAAAVGADGTAADGELAVKLADTLLMQQSVAGAV